MKLLKVKKQDAVQKKKDGADLERCRKAAFRAAWSLENATSSLNAIAIWANGLDIHEAEEILEIFEPNSEARAKKIAAVFEKAKKALEAAG